MKKGKIVLVEGCPCEVIERVEYGVLVGNENCSRHLPLHRLMVAPNGVLFIACMDLVSVCSPSWMATERNLRKLA